MSDPSEEASPIWLVWLFSVGFCWWVFVFWNPTPKPPEARVKPDPPTVIMIKAPETEAPSKETCASACGVRRSLIIEGMCNCKTERGWEEVTENE